MKKLDKLLKRLEEAIELMNFLKTLLWLGNYDERMAEMLRRIENYAADVELRDKKMKAIEDYWGITFDDKYRYTKVKQETK